MNYASSPSKQFEALALPPRLAGNLSPPAGAPFQVLVSHIWPFKGNTVDRGGLALCTPRVRNIDKDIRAEFD